MTIGNRMQARITLLRVLEQMDECLEYFEDLDEKQQETYDKISSYRDEIANYIFNESSLA